jgi:hypothetical protein
MLLLFASLVLAAADPAHPVAMVLTTGGAVRLERGKDPPQPLRTMDLLRPGDSLTTADGEAVLVFFDGRRERVKPQATISITPKGCTPGRAIEILPAAKMSAESLESLRELARSSKAGIGVLRGDNPPTPQVVTPMYGATVLTDRPAFTWPVADWAEGYVPQLPPTFQLHPNRADRREAQYRSEATPQNLGSR